MASPVDAGRAGTNISTAADPWTVTMPGSIAAGDLLIAYGRSAGTPTFNLPSDWSWLLQNIATDASDDNVSVIYRTAAGADTLSWDLSATAKGNAIVWRITGAEVPGTQPPEAPTPATFTTSANSANPPASTPTGGSKDYLFLAIAGNDGEVGAYTAAPLNYVNLQAANSGTGGLPATNCFSGGASRQITTASENPDVFTHAAATTGGLAITIAVHPAAPVVVPPADDVLMAPPMIASR